LKKLPTLEELEKIITKEASESSKTAGVEEQGPSGITNSPRRSRRDNDFKDESDDENLEEGYEVINLTKAALIH
jgi:hypothetical protein